MTEKAISKERRMYLLYRMQQVGVLDTMSLRQLGQVLCVSRTVLLRDLMDLEKAEAEFQTLMKARPWQQEGDGSSPSDPPDAEEQASEDIESLKRLVRDGMVWLQNMSGLAVQSALYEESEGQTGGEN